MGNGDFYELNTFFKVYFDLVTSLSSSMERGAAVELLWQYVVAKMLDGFKFSFAIV